MRYTSYRHDGVDRVGERRGDRLVPLDGVTDLGPSTTTSRLAAATRLEDQAVDVAAVTLRPAVTGAQKIICVGLNYKAHIDESGRKDSDYPVLFTKFPGSLLGPDDDVVLPPEAGFLDWEGELAVVIGEAGRRIPESAALDHVLGLSVANDITLRDYQYRTHQWLQGKAWDDTTPLGPDVVTLDEASATSGRITTTVNGAVEQDSDLAHFVFPVAHLVSVISEFTRLLPGDVILTGTPGGVGYRREPQLALHDGDVVTVTIEGVGAITNTVRAEAPTG
ncbi:fumarylacetoacetate hydrolase family protein [Nakamurella leprariae]|uniref:Fumarylacetoacetate hydrolase family protein n=1 Tax=Nakamurella leprariae TaxID=2803911 RepID=A0A938YCI5_9ACTN|nr:fumarylacetoacetate hydrolase family protein [Nakamurella leprariae]MBM9468122.1 fumarylacetoacetate hydrolase family protein [Nakamurella leprariae]